MNSPIDFKECNICGDDSDKIGLYYGVVTCQACKKFFWRSQGEASKNYACTKRTKCEITLVTRAKCKYCRYQKCLSIGMDIKTCSSKVTEQVVNQCTICQLPANGIHFGVISCEGCKGFFRRSQLNKKFETYECDYMCNKNDNQFCRPTITFNCKYCRYQKCLSSGMSYKNSKTGRQSNLLKKQILITRTVPVKNKKVDIEDLISDLPVSNSAKRTKTEDSLLTNQLNHMPSFTNVFTTSPVQQQAQTVPTQQYYQFTDFNPYQTRFYTTASYHEQNYFVPAYNQYQPSYYTTTEPSSDYYKFYCTRPN